MVVILKELEALRKTCDTQSSSDNVDPLLTKLSQYHDHLFSQSDNILTEKLSAEVAAVINDASQVDDVVYRGWGETEPIERTGKGASDASQVDMGSQGGNTAVQLQPQAHAISGGTWAG